MKVLFLDIDGVLNNRRFYNLRKPSSSENPLEILRSILAPENMEEMERLFNAIPDLKIVISSSWGSKYSMDVFKDLFKSYGEVVGITPKEFPQKADQILSFFENKVLKSPFRHKVKEGSDLIIEKFAIVDDENIFPLGSFYHPLKKNQVKTSFDLGWNKETTADLISILS